ncbi:MAG: SDR family oxidoreductase [Pseudomonadota bacterium]
MKKVLIIGADGNVGSAALEYFKNAKWKVAAHHKSSKSNLTEKISVYGDLTDPIERIKIIEEAWKKMDGLDAVLYAASLFKKMKFGSVTEKDFDVALSVDLKAAFFMIQEVGLKMKKQGSGSIVIMSDASVDSPYSKYIPYFIAKSGVNTIVKAAAKFLRPEVKINAIAPYIVTRPEGIDDKTWSELQKKAPQGRATRPDEVAKLIFETVNSKRAGEIIPC